jgi:uncharacterized protein DUF2637
MRTAARILVIVVGVAAMVLSFHGLTALAVRAGVAVALAWLYPVMIDVLAIVAYLRMASAVRGSHEWNASVALLAGSLGISVIGNVAPASPERCRGSPGSSWPGSRPCSCSWWRIRRWAPARPNRALRRLRVTRHRW